MLIIFPKQFRIPLNFMDIGQMLVHIAIGGKM